MAPKVVASPTIASGRRGYLRYQYGDHYWIPEILADFSKGMVRDVARIAIPDGSVYDAADYLLDQPGVARKRGGTSYYGSALSGASYVLAIIEIPGPQLLAVMNNAHLWSLTNGGATVTDKGALASASFVKPALSPGAAYTILPQVTANAQKYDGATVSTLAGGVAISHTVAYKSRLVAAAISPSNRLLFSPVPDVNATWDTANSWIDCDNQISGLAALNNALLVFSTGAMERIIGATPPPNSDMDRAPVSNVGCTDCRSIVTESPYVYFANPQGVFLTNGSTPVSLTREGGIANYWRSLFPGYVSAAPVPTASSWTIASGFWRGFLFVSVLDGSRNLKACLMCNVAQRAWWRLTNINAACWTAALDGNELYYGDALTNQLVAMSGIFNPTAANKNDANLRPVTPLIEFRPIGQGVGVKSYAWGHVDFDLRDAYADNPLLNVAVKIGLEADTALVPPESPLGESSTVTRSPRFTINRSAQAVTITLAQSGPSAKTELYAVEVQQRPQPLTGEGIG